MRVPQTTPSTVPVLLLALGGPPLLGVISRRVLGESPGVAAALPFDLVLWAILAVVLFVVLSVDRQRPESIGLRVPGLSTIGWAVALFAGVDLLLVPSLAWIVARVGLPGWERGLRGLSALPPWYRVFLALSAGVVEEVLYRGVAVERLAALTGSYARGGSVAAVAFGLAHLPAWGLGPAVAALVAGSVATLFYVWKRDLVALVIAHVVGDTVGLLLTAEPGRGP